MPSLAQTVRWILLILPVGFFAVVFWNVLTERISSESLLEGDRREGAHVVTHTSLGRSQLLLFTLFFAARYLLQVARNPHQFPSVPQEHLAVLATSQAVYLGGKAYALLWRHPANPFRRRQ